LSEFAAKRFPLHLAGTFTQAIVDYPTTESVTSAFRTAFATFDESLSKVFEKIPDKEGEWEPYEVHEILGPKAKASEPDSLFGAMRRAAVGTTALVGYINRSKKDLWVASLGDSEACKLSPCPVLLPLSFFIPVIGRLMSDDYNRWNATPLYEAHNTTNQDEVNRLIREHPGEDVIKNGRLLGFLSVTRGVYSVYEL
jgi:pyruvate dehydrogenase phosphatase